MVPVILLLIHTQSDREVRVVSEGERSNNILGGKHGKLLLACGKGGAMVLRVGRVFQYWSIVGWCFGLLQIIFWPWNEVSFIVGLLVTGIINDLIFCSIKLRDKEVRDTTGYNTFLSVTKVDYCHCRLILVCSHGLLVDSCTFFFTSFSLVVSPLCFVNNWSDEGWLSVVATETSFYLSLPGWCLDV